MSARNEATLRRIIVEAIAATGGAASPEASIAFLSYLPAEIKAALGRERAAREKAERALMEGKSGWPQSLSALEASLGTFPAGRDFLRRWEQAERALAEERAHGDRLMARLVRKDSHDLGCPCRLWMTDQGCDCERGRLLAEHAARRGGDNG